MHFDQWWNSQAADEFRAKHPDMDGEAFRPVWDAAIAAMRERWRDKVEALAESWDDPAEAYGMKLAINEGLGA